jgi:hypothetical protein
MEAEFRLCQVKCEKQVLMIDSPSEILDQCTYSYLNISKLLQSLYLFTTVSAERKISILRRLKTWLRSMMTKDRLIGIALLDIEVSRDAALDRFLRKNKRICACKNAS